MLKTIKLLTMQEEAFRNESRVRLAILSSHNIN